MSGARPAIDVAAVERWLDRLWIAAEGAGLRAEERKKARELAGLLDEVARAVDGCSATRPLRLVDAAAGKAYVGILAARLLFAPSGRAAQVVVIERDPARVAASRAAAAAAEVEFEAVCADVADPAAWPDEPDVVVALHACGPAADAGSSGRSRRGRGDCCWRRAAPRTG